MDLWDWSQSIRFLSEYRKAYFSYEGLMFNFNIYKNNYSCEISSTTDNSILLKFKDTLDDPRLGLNNFSRIIYKKNKDGKWNLESETYHYSLGVEVGYSKEWDKVNFISYKKEDKNK